MKLAKMMSVSVAAIFVAFSGALAQQAHTGVVTEVNRLSGTVAIRQIQNGTVGAANGGPSEAFKVQSGISLDSVHAGDRVSYLANETGGTKTITKIDRQ